MVRKLGPLFVVALVVTLAFGGCGRDTVVPTDNEQSNTSGLIAGDISADDGSFEYTTDTAGDPNSPVPGPFIIRGKNIHYVDSLQVLSVDFTVEHRCRCAFPEPIGLTFVTLLPDTVTVENPDNGVHGAGAAIVFEFENDDGVWSPFEESLPRTVHFGVGHGTSIGFVARIDIGMEPGLGSIGGVVWHDINEDGVMDQDEPGIGGVEVQMYRTDGPEVSPPEILWRTFTAHDGSYRFDGLSAGHYEVHKIPRNDLIPTTPEILQVILVEIDGQVSDFLMANFGCVPRGWPRPIIEVGDFVDVWGKYGAANPVEPRQLRPYVTSRLIHVVKCGDPPPEPALSPASISDDGQDIDVCRVPAGVLVGPVTHKSDDDRVLWVMGTPVRFDSIPVDTLADASTFVGGHPGGDEPLLCGELDFDDVKIGDRVTVFALNDPALRALLGIKIYEPRGDEDEVHGKVEQILTTPNSITGIIDAFVVMRTMVIITHLTEIHVGG